MAGPGNITGSLGIFFVRPLSGTKPVVNSIYVGVQKLSPLRMESLILTYLKKNVVSSILKFSIVYVWAKGNLIASH